MFIIVDISLSRGFHTEEWSLKLPWPYTGSQEELGSIARDDQLQNLNFLKPDLFSQ